MFELPYNYKCVNKQTIEKRNFRYEEIKHTFNCRFNQQYIVNVERYDNEIYIIKFHLKNHSNSDNKYSILSGLHDMSRIMATCIKIMLDIYHKNPYASFGFIGANSLGETQDNTKRFKIYRRIMENCFSPIKFSHHIYLEKSAYLMLSRTNITVDNLLQKVETMFDNYYFNY